MNRQLEILRQLAENGDAWAQEQLAAYDETPCRLSISAFCVKEPECRSLLNLLVDMTQYPIAYESLAAMFESVCECPLPDRSREEINEWIICGWYHIARRLDELAGRLGFVYDHFLLANMSNCWGRCNFQTRAIAIVPQMLLQPPTLIDSLLVHELCHLLHPHHRPPFWKSFNTAMAKLGFKTANDGKKTQQRLVDRYYLKAKNRRIGVSKIINRTILQLYGQLPEAQRQQLCLRYDYVF